MALAEVARFDEAIAQLEAAARRHDSADLRFDLGYVYGKQHRLDDAIRECLAALRLDPDHFGAHAQLGLALLSSRRIDEASVHLRRAAELAPQRSESPRIMRMLALGYADEGRFPEAALAAQRALELARGVGDLDLSEQCSRELAASRRGERGSLQTLGIRADRPGKDKGSGSESSRSPEAFGVGDAGLPRPGAPAGVTTPKGPLRGRHLHRTQPTTVQWITSSSGLPSMEAPRPPGPLGRPSLRDRARLTPRERTADEFPRGETGCQRRKCARPRTDAARGGRTRQDPPEPGASMRPHARLTPPQAGRNHEGSLAARDLRDSRVGVRSDAHGRS